MATTIFGEFERHVDADLVLDAVYVGGSQKNVGADPLAKLLHVGNQGGFRPAASRHLGRSPFVAMFTTGAEHDWPDLLDPQTGIFTYYGDNRQPGRELHDTKRRGNQLLRQVFDALHGHPARRHEIPPFFIFAREGTSWDIKFRGIAVPGATGVAAMDDLVAVWKSKDGDRFQNYKATFTVLDCARVSREWIHSLERGETESPHAPAAWVEWVLTGRYAALEADTIQAFRSPEEQLPQDAVGQAMLRATYEHFKSSPHAFEPCAAQLWQMVSPGVVVDEITRPSRDGGRDALGRLTVGPRVDPISLSYALEAKCYDTSHGATVADTARLISRLRHREFGVFVTTSYVGRQAYQEIRHDRHPVVIMAGADIVSILRGKQISSPEDTKHWLNTQFGNT